MIRLFHLKWIITALFATAITLTAFVIVSTQTPVESIPDWTRYTPGREFDIRGCFVYTESAYQHAERGGIVGYCTVNFIPPGTRAIHISMSGDVIVGVTIFIEGGDKIQNYVKSWGQPLKIRHWAQNFQFTWPHATIMARHRDGGSVDNLEIMYIYMY